TAFGIDQERDVIDGGSRATRRHPRAERMRIDERVQDRGARLLVVLRYVQRGLPETQDRWANVRREAAFGEEPLVRSRGVRQEARGKDWQSRAGRSRPCTMPD